MKKPDYAVMVLSCDKNADLLPIFFTNFKKYWPQYTGDIFVNIETERNSIRGENIKYPSRKFSSSTAWSQRLYECLKEVPYDYVVLLLDDFVFSAYVDTSELDRVFDIMRADEDIACFNFQETYKDKEDSEGEYFGRYYLKKKNAEFRINLQAALWKKDFLLKFIRKHENPWQFETWGSIRARRYKEKIFHIKKEAPHVFFYLEGGVLADGKWREDESVNFLKEEGFNLDYSIRGIYHEGDSRKTEIKHRTFIQKVWEVVRSLV